MRLLRWWASHDMPRAARLLRRAGAWDNPAWARAGDAGCRARWHGYRLRLDLSHYHQRGVFFYGRLFDLPVQLCIIHALRPGDTFLDGGGHIGLTSMLAAWRVGPAGRVLTFEPNPAIYPRLRWHVEANSLDQVTTFPFALSDRAERLTLSVPDRNSGAATLGQLPDRLTGLPRAHHEITTRIGDELLDELALPDRPLFIKLDVEGHETALLRGLRSTLGRRRPGVLLECNPEMLERSGSSAAELFELLGALGYRPFALSARWQRWARRYDLVIHPRPPSWRPPRTTDVLFLHPRAEYARRLGRFLASAK